MHSLSINHPHQPGSNAFMGLDDEQANIIEELKLENNDLGHQQITLISNFHNLRKLWIIKKAGYAATKDLS